MLRIRAGLPLLLALLLAGCSGSSPPPAGAPAVAPGPPPAKPAASNPTTVALAPLGDYHLLEVSLGSAVDVEQRVTAAQAVFSPTQTLHLSALGSATSTGLNLSARWLTADGVVIAQAEQTLAPGPATVTGFRLSHPTGWPLGRYKVELALNGNPVDHREFEVR